MKNILTKIITIILWIIFTVFLSAPPIFSATLGDVKDINNGNKGYILIHAGEISGKYNDVGEWIDPSFLKGEPGKDVDPSTVINLQNADQTLQDNINVEQFDRIKLGNDLVNNISFESLQRQKANTQLNNRINDTNNKLNGVEHRVNQLEQTQYNVEGIIRILDTKKTTTEIFNTYDVRHSRNVAIGVRFTYKFGKSYQDRVNEENDLRLKNIENKLGTSIVITKIVDNKGKIKSIEISDGLNVKGEF